MSELEPRRGEQPAGGSGLERGAQNSLQRFSWKTAL